MKVAEKLLLFGFLTILNPILMAAPNNAKERVVTKALYSYFNQKTGELVLKGNAQVKRDDLSLFADKILYMEKKKEAFATGNVKLVSADFTLEAGQIRVYLVGNETLKRMSETDTLVIAQKHPRLLEKADKGDLFNQVTAVEIKFFKGRETIESFENVKMVQLKQEGVELLEQMVITGEYMEYKHLQKKALVKNNVKLESKDLGGEGERLIYYQKGNKFYLIDSAKVYEYDKRGKVANTIQGNKILHLIDEGRTILMGNVEGSLEYDG